MILTGKEIKELAECAGFIISSNAFGEDDLEAEYSIDRCPEKGVMNDDGTVEHYGYVVTCDGCEGNECTPLGDPIAK